MVINQRTFSVLSSYAHRLAKQSKVLYTDAVQTMGLWPGRVELDTDIPAEEVKAWAESVLFLFGDQNEQKG